MKICQNILNRSKIDRLENDGKCITLTQFTTLVVSVYLPKLFLPLSLSQFVLFHSNAQFLSQS